MLAQQAARDNRPAEVAGRIERAIELDARNPEMYHQSAILLSSAGLNADARKRLLEGWELAPEAPQFPYSLGLLAAETGDLQGAAAYLEETVAMAPDFYRAWYNLSLAYTRLDRPEDARRAMQRARGEP
jgi:tetratricopeptide (TPR) repeat protein